MDADKISVVIPKKTNAFILIIYFIVKKYRG